MDPTSLKINPYASPSTSTTRPKRPPRQLDAQFWRGLGCLAVGAVLSVIGVNFLLYGEGVMPMFIVGGGPILIMVGLIYLFFWFTD